MARLLALIIFVALFIDFTLCGVFYIGAIFDQNVNLNTQILNHAVEQANSNILFDSGVELKPGVANIEYGNVFQAAETVCDLLTEKSNAIFAPKSPAASAHIASICDVKEVPYIDTHTDIFVKKAANINLYPSEQDLSQLLIDVVDQYKWTDLTILYEAPFYSRRIGRFLEDRNDKTGKVAIQPLEVGTDFRKTLQKIKDLEDQSKSVIIESSIEHLYEIMEQILQVGLFTPDRNFIITNLDAQTINLEPFRFTKSNITLFRLIDFDSNDKREERESIRVMLEEELDRCKNRGSSCSLDEMEELQTEFWPISTALIYDAIMLLAETLKSIGLDFLDIRPDKEISCFDPQSNFGKGYTIENFIKTVYALNYTGLTGPIEFNSLRERSNVNIDVMALNSNGLEKVGSFKLSAAERLSFIPPPEKELSEDLSISEQTFKVVISIVDPYVMMVDTSDQLDENDQYEGFCIDIIKELAELYKFNYIFINQEDKVYGSKIDNNTNEWSGMIGKVLRGEADLAITDLTINSARIEALDFTPSFMNLGIALLYRKPSVVAPTTFAFMAPFAYDVWWMLGVSYILVSLCFFVLGRVSNAQWENRYPCVDEPKFLENQFTLNNSLWFAAGALLQQGSELEPKSFSLRLAASFWWFFTLIMVSSYTANLATFLVKPTKVSAIDGVEDLYKCGEEGYDCPVKFGAKSDGATMTFFRNASKPEYKNMYNYMMKHPEDLTQGNEEGILRVHKGKDNDPEDNYAFLMESKSIEYVTQRLCNLTLTGDKIDDKNYGIGMRKGFKYAPDFNEGILQLQENGKLAELEKKWWEQRRGGGACSDEDEGDADPLEFENLKGVFLVLVCGTIFAIIYGYTTLTIKVYKLAKLEKRPFKTELMAELKFLLSGEGIKRVRFRKSSKSHYSGTSSRYSGGTNSQIHGSNQLLNLD